MARVLYFDCFSGAAGDMVLGALIDAGLPLDELRRALGSLGVDHDVRATRVVRAGISATHIEVVGQHDHDHAHHHHHHHDHDHHHQHAHAHRTLHQIEQLIHRSALPDAGRQRAIAMFHRLGEAEAAIHQIPIDQVHLHEVGAIDSIIDIVGAVFALEWFGIDDIVSSPLNVGSGTIQIAHGTFPVPAPATLRLLAGAPVYSSGISAELVTPTGALIISTYAKSYGPFPAMTIDRVGYGAGTRDFEAVPNVLRVAVGERATEAASATTEQIVKLECEIDDMSPQLFGAVGDRLFAAGALDVFMTPVVMKKGRPGTLLTVLGTPDRREALCDLVFRETTTLGVRVEPVWREILDREWVEVPVNGGHVRVKVSGRRGEVLNAVPEFEDCLRLANATGRPVKTIQAEALRAWFARSRQ